MSYNNSDYTFLADEDKAFCQAARLTEDDFLKIAGGLASYTIFRLDRDAARNVKVGQGDFTKTFDVPPLPSSTEDFVSQIMLPGVTEAYMAALLFKDQKEKVAGILDGAEFDKKLKASGAIQPV